MVGFRYVVFAFILFFAGSCAQVGTISGGPEDTAAPRPLFEKSTPPNGTTHFRGNSVEIPFDEFFSLNQPNLTVRMVPPHAKISTQVKKKSLFLHWEDSLSPNTTYAIYLNNTVKDITEGNDSIFQYVFSTGPEIDTLSYTLSVVDAWSGAPVKETVVALFSPEDRSLVSFAETDKKGIATLGYLKAGSYHMRAFDDENHDLKPQKHEKIGFPTAPMTTIAQPVVDSIPIRLFSPLLDPKITTTKIIAPGYLVVGTNRDLENEQLYLNGKQVARTDYLFLAKDSIKIALSKELESPVELVIHSDQLSDTSTFRVGKNDRITPIRISIPSTSLAPSDAVILYSNARITSVDTSLLILTNNLDSTRIRDFSLKQEFNELKLYLEKDSLSSVSLLFSPGAITTPFGSNQEFKSSITLNKEENYGSLKVDLQAYSNVPILLFMQNGKKTEKKLVLKSPPASLFLSEIPPGDYTFTVVIDANKNGKWDVGQLEEQIQPEEVHRYSSPTKVRANWEVELSLIPKPSP